MSNRSNERLPMVIALGVFVALAQLGCLVAIGFAAWGELMSPASPFAYLPDLRSAVVFRGEVYFRVEDMKVGGTREELWAFDLKTGRVREAIGATFSTYRGWVTDGERLWGIGDREVLETDGTTTVTHRPKRLLNAQTGWAFLYEGCPAVLDRDLSDTERLLVLVDGEWEDKGQIAAPPGSGSRQALVFDERIGGAILVPPATGLPRYTKVVPVGETYHLFQLHFWGQKGSIYYREGLDLRATPADDSPPSALDPINAPAESAGWTCLNIECNPYFFGFGTLHRAPLFGGFEGEFWKPSEKNGTQTTRFAMSKNQADPRLTRGITFVSQPDGPEIYALAMSQSWGVDVFRYDGERLTAMPYHIEGAAQWMVRFWTRFVLKVLGVASVGTVLLLVIGSCLLPKANEASHSFGLTTVQLAPLGRRCLAKGIDLTLLITPVVVQMAWLLSIADSETLYTEVTLFSFQYHPEPAQELGRLMLPASCWAVTVFLAIVRYEGRYGVTPGKWLCGVRTLRTTLRPCGFARALLRELLMWFDAPLLLTVIPGMTSLLCTDRRQRIGDLIADTIVVDHRAPERS
ncbi:MAG: RDD family protein [Candidatus Saccharimonas sp.]|nr:RDD family protein [Planctomycetaceae bacterium]